MGRCRGDFSKWSYNYTSKVCVKSRGCGREGGNWFDNQQECNKICRDPDYGLCAAVAQNPCTRKIRKSAVWFDPTRRTCTWYSHGDCIRGRNVFQDTATCYEKCGEYAVSPCVMPIVPARATCSNGAKVELRYGYNSSNQKCEQYWYSSCSGNQNNFRTLKECFARCRPDSRCLKPYQKPSGKFLPVYSSYYFDIENVVCKSERSITRPNSGPKYNRFSTEQECKDKCMPLKVAIWSGGRQG